MKKDLNQTNGKSGKPIDMDPVNWLPKEEQVREAYIENRKNEIRAFYRNRPPGKYISGIYNYCDRWCERCKLANKCSVFVLEETLDEDEDEDHKDEFLVEDLEANLRATMEMLKEQMEEMGMDVELIADEELDKDEEWNRDLALEEDELLALSNHYAKNASEWLRSISGDEVDLNDENHEALSIINWYDIFISAKISRAIHNRNTDIEPNPIQNDSNGSAKIALIGIKNSLYAWSCLINNKSPYEDVALKNALLLCKLKNAMEERFPDAEKFVRPGFDQ